MDKTIGFTTTIPVELIFAAGDTPCDLNNIFITDENPMDYIEVAEREGFPKSMCNWIKGIYGVIRRHHIETVITVMEGDCSNTQALAEILRYRGVKVIPFSYPYDRDREVLSREIEKLGRTLGVDWDRLGKVEQEIMGVRNTLARIDEMTWRERTITGGENHLWLVRSSDMLGDYGAYGRDAETFVTGVKDRAEARGVAIGYIGVPPILIDLYEFIDSIGGHVVYNETQRQFSLPFEDEGFVERYLKYTYPYGIFARLEDMKAEIAKRRIKGVIHYVQAFCYRAMEDVILRETLGVPVITVEGDMPKRLDSRTKLRIEAFVEMLSHSD